MSQNSSPPTPKPPAERVVRDMRHTTLRYFAAEYEIRIVLEGLRAMTALPPSAGARASPRVAKTLA